MPDVIDNNADNNDGSKSLGSTSSADSDEPKEMYADLAGLKHGKITYKLDKKKNFYWADYSRLSVKEMKSLLQQRDQGTSGTEDVLARRLESGDCARLARLSCWLLAGKTSCSLMRTTLPLCSS
eukprot:scaffold3740_cov51-Cyclotella_meneghiniana.AAC.10